MDLARFPANSARGIDCRPASRNYIGTEPEAGKGGLRFWGRLARGRSAKREECGVRIVRSCPDGAPEPRPPGDTSGTRCRSNGETVMDAVVTNFPKAAAPAVEKAALSDHVRAAPVPAVPRPSRAEAEAAVRTLLCYIGDNPDREGLVETPKRFVNAYEELFAGYQECPAEVLDRTFSEIGSYAEPVLVRDIPFYSH